MENAAPHTPKGRVSAAKITMKKFWTHEHEETIRTVNSIISIVFQIVMLSVQLYGLHYIMTHSH